ncbi:MAG: hypothetical protein H7835_04605 [Magnetococcus sp. XQGC-1]
MKNILVLFVLVMSLAVYSPTGLSGEFDDRTEFFFKLHMLCMRHLDNLQALQDQLDSQKLPKLPPEKAAFFLSRKPGNAWPVPYQKMLGNFALALPTSKNICLLYARRINDADVQRRFVKMAENPPKPLTAEKIVDEITNTVINGEVHSVFYEWSFPNAQRKIVLFLSTASSEKAEIQVSLSTAIVHDGVNESKRIADQWQGFPDKQE